MSRFCQSCGAAVSDIARFCKKCGARLEEAEEKVFCEICGAELEAGSEFCELCGAKQTSSIDESAGSEAWSDVMVGLAAAEEEAKFSEFEYEKRPDGSIVITGLKDKYAVNVEIPAGVSVIAEEAFAETKIISVRLPEGVVTIDRRAFFNCNNLIEVALPSSLMMICDEAFAECERLDLEFPETVRIFGEDILRGSKADLLMKEEQARVERIARERAEAERIERERAEAKTKAPCPAVWEANLHLVGDPNDRTDPKEYGFSVGEAHSWLNHYQGLSDHSNPKKWQAFVALAKGLFLGSWGNLNKELGLSCIRVAASCTNDPGIIRLRDDMERGII